MKGGCFGTKCLSIASITHHGEIAKFYIICKREKNTLFEAFIGLFLDPVTFDIILFLVITRLKILSVLPTKYFKSLLAIQLNLQWTKLLLISSKSYIISGLELHLPGSEIKSSKSRPSESFLAVFCTTESSKGLCCEGRNLDIFFSYFGRKDDFLNSLWNYLTFKNQPFLL